MTPQHEPVIGVVEQALTVPSLHGDDWRIHFLKVRVGLSLIDITLGSNAPHPPSFVEGDKFELNDCHLIPDFDRITSLMTEELLLSGTLKCEAKYEETETVVLTLKPSITSIQRLYLTAIFFRMRESGYFLELDENNWKFILHNDTEDAGHAFSLGYLISEYFWKFTHEAAAVQGHKTSEGLEIARTEAKREKNKKSSETRSTIKTLAQELCNQNSELKHNTSKLAKAISEHADCPLKHNGQAPLTRNTIRNILIEISKKKSC